MNGTENRTAKAEAARLVERAKSTDVDDALTSYSPLAVDVSGKYVNILFTTGGPHLEVTVEYDDAEDAECWYEMTPRGAWVTAMDWGTRDDYYIGAREAELIVQAITRNPEEMEAGTYDD